MSRWTLVGATESLRGFLGWKMQVSPNGMSWPNELVRIRVRITLTLILAKRCMRMAVRRRVDAHGQHGAQQGLLRHRAQVPRGRSEHGVAVQLPVRAPPAISRLGLADESSVLSMVSPFDFPCALSCGAAA